MLTMDPLAISIAGIFLIGGLIVVMKFISDRPKRQEMYDAIDRSVEPISSDLKYLRDRIDELIAIAQKR